ncbi:MAG: hypothetical protein U0521_05490 [Anaerolineae bacterium]
MVEHRREELYPLLEQIVAATRSGDLHRYAVIQMAAARDPALNEMLFALAKRCPVERAPNFVEALELVPGSDAVLKLLQGRTK